MQLAKKRPPKMDRSSSNSSSSSSEKRPKLLVTIDFSASQDQPSPTQFKQDEVAHHQSPTEQKESTQRQINIVQRK
jgi:hypothetical protein